MERSVSSLFSTSIAGLLSGREVRDGGPASKLRTPGSGGDSGREAPQANVLTIAAWHSLGWLFASNLIGVWLAILLLFPNAGRFLGEWSYGRWTPVHLNFQLYGWIALPLVAWAMRIYGAD